MSSNLTVVVSVMHFSLIHFPITAPAWYKSGKIKLHVCIAILLSSITGISRFLSYQYVTNTFQDIPSISSLQLIVEKTSIGRFLYDKAAGIHNMIDVLLPPIIVLVLESMSYVKVSKIQLLYHLVKRILIYH